MRSDNLSESPVCAPLDAPTNMPQGGAKPQKRASSLLVPDLEMAIAFRDFLEPGGELTFQVIAESRTSDAARSEHRHGRLEDLAQWLTVQNQAGAGVFAMVNRGDGAGRKKSNVMSVRAAFVDLDGAPLEPILASALPPDLVVESSPGKWHAYWRLIDCPLEKFPSVQSALAERFGSDPAVKDLPRVMRLPGFYHHKGDPFMTRITHTNTKTSGEVS